MSLEFENTQVFDVFGNWKSEILKYLLLDIS